MQQPPPAPWRALAKEYPFELDAFQRDAIHCIEADHSVLVCAHTSAGKTVCAEHAIAAALRDGQRAIYASPIKALSNQKYRQLHSIFKGDVGLITGDVTLSEDASCLVVTTEVLRVMLYRGATAMREVKWVIFDEVHMLGSPDRGWVVEETLMMLPASVRVVLLSATVPNASEVADWLTSLHGQPVHVVVTSTRPTPLRHYVCPLNGRGLHLVSDEHSSFDEAQWHSAVIALPKPKAKSSDEDIGGEAAGEVGASDEAPNKRALKHSAEVIRVVSRFDSLAMLPAIVFCFSRRECELIASQMGRAIASAESQQRVARLAPDSADGSTGAASSAVAQGTGENGSGNNGGGQRGGDQESAAPRLQLLGVADAQAVEEIYAGAVSVLAEEDARLPQVTALLPLLRAGVGVHHSGMLPVLRELVEILFAEGLLRVLFATETLSMGLNLPARTVVFSAPNKFDGQAMRLLKPTEYTQMAGRAGRRGLDAQGYSVLLLSHWLSAAEGEQMLSSRYAPLRSQFELRFSSLLKLLRTEGLGAQTVLARNFKAWQQARAIQQRDQRLEAAEKQLLMLDAEAASASELHSQADGYLLLRARLERLGRAFERRVRLHSRPWLQPGRVVHLNDGRGWAVVVSCRGASAFGSDGGGGSDGDDGFDDESNGGMAIDEGEGTRGSEGTEGVETPTCLLTGDVSLHVLAKGRFNGSGGQRKRLADASGADAYTTLNDDGKGGEARASNASAASQPHDGDKAEAEGEEEAATMSLVSVPLASVRQLSSVRLWMPRDLQRDDARASVALALAAAIESFDGELPPLDPIEDMRLTDRKLFQVCASHLETRNMAR